MRKIPKIQEGYFVYTHSTVLVGERIIVQPDDIFHVGIGHSTNLYEFRRYSGRSKQWNKVVEDNNTFAAKVWYTGLSKPLAVNLRHLLIYLVGVKQEGKVHESLGQAVYAQVSKKNHIDDIYKVTYDIYETVKLLMMELDKNKHPYHIPEFKTHIINTNIRNFKKWTTKSKTIKSSSISIER